MVMMWTNDDDLFNYIKKTSNDEKYTWYKRFKILEELSGALKSIHGKGVIHHDLHCGNILMNDDDIFHFPAIENPEKFTTASDIYSLESLCG
ncbi:hypothetical protein C1646_766492 [Rhizophagus diaphanus]|nr:hypothetical protein C1646_766492 [Rhizophagus diaphanus] [Rhizophagus sp. MUCL 43196]